MDRLQRDSEDKSFRNVDFQAYFVNDVGNPEIQEAFRKMVGVDGFIFNTTALYKIEAGHQWYVQVLYSIGPNFKRYQTKKNEYLGFQDASNRMIRSAVFEVNDIKNGSSLKGIRLKHEFSQNSGQFEDRDFIWLAIVGVLLIVIKYVFENPSANPCKVVVNAKVFMKYLIYNFHDIL